MAIACYAALKPKGKLQKFRYDEPDPLGPMEVLIKISHCGICHSDIHLIDNDWQISEYPLVPGHEIVGTVERIGKNVIELSSIKQNSKSPDSIDEVSGRFGVGMEKLNKDLKTGQRVGVGWQSGSCLRCEWCQRGEENLCEDSEATAVGHYGGFAQKVITDSRFAFPIPQKLESETAAPLLCGGITVYSPLRRLVKKGDNVGVIGIGGLGHFALQFAHALGHEVTAFSHTPGKEKEAKGFGADYFVSSTDTAALKKLTRRFDFILATVNVSLDWTVYLNMLRPNGRLCVVGAVDKPLAIPSGAIISGQKGVIASVIGGRPLITEMLDFSARHDVKAVTEVLPLDEVNRAVDKVRKGRARYRMVLKME